MAHPTKTLSRKDGHGFLRRAFKNDADQALIQVLLWQASHRSIGDPREHRGGGGQEPLVAALQPGTVSVDTAIVINNVGKTSDQIGLVTFDEHFTPTLSDQENHRYVPADAVYAMGTAPAIDWDDYAKCFGLECADDFRA